MFLRNVIPRNLDRASPLHLHHMLE